MKKNWIIKSFTSLAIVAMALVGCVDKDTPVPPVTSIPAGDVTLTISEAITQIGNGTIDLETTTVDVYGYIIADERSGNFYKEIYVQDSVSGVDVRMTESGGFTTGDYIRIHLGSGNSVQLYNGMPQFGNISPDSNIVILENTAGLEPKLVTIEDLSTDDYTAQLVKIDGVQFATSELGKTYSDPITLVTTNRTLEDTLGHTTLVRTSGYASFAGEPIPEGNGSIITVVGVYNDEYQLYIRSFHEVALDNPRVGGGGGGGGTVVDPVDNVEENFDNATNYTDIAIDGWNNILVTGDRSWQGKEFDTDRYAQASGYNSGLSAMETWIITPPVKNQDGDKILSFKSGIAYWTHGTDLPYAIKASLDFDGSNFETATWTDITERATLPTEASANYAWIVSGDVDLSDFEGNVAIGFVYTGSDSKSTSWLLDDVLINTEGGGGGGGGGDEPIPPVESVNEMFDAAANYTDIAIDGWKNIAVEGSRSWQGKVFDTDKYAQASGYNSSLDVMETWLITPPVTNSAGDKNLSFTSCIAYWEHTGNPFQIMVSTEYDGTNQATATWIDITDQFTMPTSATANYTWIESGSVSLADYTGNVTVAFKYSGSNTESTSWCVDSVVVE